MASVEIEQLRALARRLSTAASQGRPEDFVAVGRLEDAAQKVARSWSGSSLGYHAVVYYRDFVRPPAGSNFSSEWGLQSRISGTGGEWVECAHSDVITYIEKIARDPDLAEFEWHREQCADEFLVCRDEFRAIVEEYLKNISDPYVDEMRNKAEELQIVSITEAISAYIPDTQPPTQDSRAAAAGLAHSPHHEVLARVRTLRSPFTAAKSLGGLAERVSSHLERVSNQAMGGPREGGRMIFIGHGRSGEWRKLSDFIQNRLKLGWDEFNRVSAAGVATMNRLEEMLDDAAMAFIVMTAEDEMSDGAMRARENVVHEAGLFQGRLGFKRAIVLVEDGCDEFSNIHGIGQIVFPKGRLEATFEEVRRVLEREGLSGTGR